LAEEDNDNETLAEDTNVELHRPKKNETRRSYYLYIL